MKHQREPHCPEEYCLILHHNKHIYSRKRTPLNTCSSVATIFMPNDLSVKVITWEFRLALWHCFMSFLWLSFAPAAGFVIICVWMLPYKQYQYPRAGWSVDQWPHRTLPACLEPCWPPPSSHGSKREKNVFESNELMQFIVEPEFNLCYKINSALHLLRITLYLFTF